MDLTTLFEGITMKSILPPVIPVVLVVGGWAYTTIIDPPEPEWPLPRIDVDHYCKQATSSELCEAGEQIYYGRLKSVWSSIPMSVRKCCVESNPNGDYMDLGVCIGLFRNFGYYPMGNETSRCGSS